MIVGFDTGVLLRAVEGPHHARTLAVEWFRRAESDPGGLVVASELARAECLVLPERLGDADLQRRFERFFAESGIVLVDVTRDVLDRAVVLRARERLKMVDAIHVATALVSGCDVILSTDEDIHGRGRFGPMRAERFPI